MTGHEEKNRSSLDRLHNTHIHATSLPKPQVLPMSRAQNRQRIISTYMAMNGLIRNQTQPGVVPPPPTMSPPAPGGPITTGL